MSDTITLHDPKREHTFALKEYQAEMIFQIIQGHTHALKNWTASAVEAGETEKAKELVRDLREHEALFACFNMEGKRTVAVMQNREMLIHHEPRDPRHR